MTKIIDKIQENSDLVIITTVVVGAIAIILGALKMFTKIFTK